MTVEEMGKAGFISERLVITDEAGRPVRDVWFRKSIRDDLASRMAEKARKASLG